MEAMSSSIVDDVISIGNNSLSNSTLQEGRIHIPICPVPLENKEIDWFMVGKGIALSMGQGMFDPSSILFKNKRNEIHISLLISNFLCSVWNQSSRRVNCYKSWRAYR